MNIKFFTTIAVACLLLLGNPAFADAQLYTRALMMAVDPNVLTKQYESNNIKGWLRLNVKSLKLTKDNWGDLGDDKAELRLLIVTDNNEGMQATLTIPSNNPIKAEVNQTVQLPEVGMAVGIPVSANTSRFYVMAVDDDEQDFKASMAENALINFFAKQVNKNAAKLLYKAKNGTIVAYLLGVAAEEGASAVKSYLEKHDKLGVAVIDVNGNKGWNQDTTITSEENSVEFAYETKFTPTEKHSATTSSADDTPRSSSRESSSRKSGQYRINGDGTVTDTKTGLMWKRCSEGQSGDSCSGTADKYKWDDAMSKFRSGVSFAGYPDWRMPNKEELRTLMYCSNGTPQEEAWDYGCSGKDNKAGEYQKPTINQTAFPNAPPAVFWSASPHADYGDDAWLVYFNGAHDDWSSKDLAFLVRLVRSGQ